MTVICHLLVSVCIVPLTDEVVVIIIGKLCDKSVWQSLLQQISIDIKPAVQFSSHSVFYIVFVTVLVIAQILGAPVRKHCLY